MMKRHRQTDYSYYSYGIERCGEWENNKEMTKGEGQERGEQEEKTKKEGV